jgi:subtilisin-like proprotein convertase family protein
MNKKTSKHPGFTLVKSLAAVIAVLSLAQADLAVAQAKVKNKKGEHEFEWGSMSKLQKKTRTFTNSTPIKINDECADPDNATCALLLDKYTATNAPAVQVTPATPYASIIEVPEWAFAKGAKITDIDVVIKDIHHDYLNDVDMLLVAPDGRWVMLASNVSAAGATAEGGVLGITAAGLNWKFDDSATLPLPRSVRDDGRLNGRDTNPLYNVIYNEWVGVWTDTSLRTFKPTDYDNNPDSDHFPNFSTEILGNTTSFNTATNSVPLTTSTVLGTVVADDPTTYKKVLNGPTLSSLNGMSPTGQWRLIVVDDFYWFGGEIKGGWSLEITAQK